jgi:hypothetical protein
MTATTEDHFPIESHLHAGVRVRVCARVHVCMCVCVCARMCVCMCVFLIVFIDNMFHYKVILHVSSFLILLLVYIW